MHCLLFLRRPSPGWSKAIRDSRENFLKQHGKGHCLGILRLCLTRASLGLAQDDSYREVRLSYQDRNR